MSDRLIVCNLARLREVALRHGARWESMEIDAPTVLALVEAVQALHDWYEYTTGDRSQLEHETLSSLLDRQERALAMFTYEHDPEP
jgi:hypothetical protein